MSHPIRASVLVAVLALPAAGRAQTLDVNVVNPPGSPGAVITPRDTFPFVVTQNVAAVGAVSGAATWNDLVPAGYRLILDRISLHGRTPALQRLWGVIHPCDNLVGSPWGTTPLVTVAWSEGASGSHFVHEGIANVGLYVDPGCVTSVSLQRNSSTGGFSAWVTLQGHLVPQQASGR